MLPKIEELISKQHYEVIMQYLSYGPNIVICKLKRPYIKHMWVQAVSSNEELALERALQLLDKVKDLETKLGKPVAVKEPEKQTYEKGYLRERQIDDIEVEFKRHGDTFDITSIYRKDENGFVYYEEPEEIEESETVFPLKNSKRKTHYEKHHLDFKLNEGEEIWCWDNIGFLSGSAGLIIVKDGKAIKRKCCSMS